MRIDVIVTRHPALIELLKEMKNFDVSDAKVLTHIEDSSIIEGKIVCGVLPHSLSCLCDKFIEIPLKIPSDLRGKELSLDQMRQYGSNPVIYRVKLLPTGLLDTDITHSLRTLYGNSGIYMPLPF